MLRDFKSEIKLFLLVGIAAIAVSIGVILVLKSLPKEESVEVQLTDEFVEEVLSISTDSKEYERLEIAPLTYTIQNISDRPISSTWSGSATGFHIYYQIYDKEEGEWKTMRHVFRDSAPSLQPDEQINVTLNDVLLSFSNGELLNYNTPQRLRIGVEYLDSKECTYPDYIEDQDTREFCYTQKNVAYSPEFSIEGAIKEAVEFCEGRVSNLDEFSFGPSITLKVYAAGPAPTDEDTVGPVQYFDYDGDLDKEIVGVCEPDGWGGYMALFVLDRQPDGTYHPVLTEDLGHEGPMRSYSFAKLRVEDINGDGIEEIMHISAGWYGGGGSASFSLYSPKDRKWFRVTKQSGDGVGKSEVIFSTTFTEEQQFIRDFLSEEGEKL